MAQRDILIKNFNEYFELAEFALNKKKYNGAVTLYYKALVELCDISLLETTGRLGANHTERFKLLKTNKPSLYPIASKLFGFYRDSYSTAISEVIAIQVKQRVEDAKKQVFKD